jgi:hypothetical protein
LKNPLGKKYQTDHYTSIQQGIIALTYAKVIITKLDGFQNSSSFVLYILEN